VRVAEHCHWLPREVVKIFKSHLDLVLGRPLQVSLLEHKDWTR